MLKTNSMLQKTLDIQFSEGGGPLVGTGVPLSSGAFTSWINGTLLPNTSDVTLKSGLLTRLGLTLIVALTIYLIYLLVPMTLKLLFIHNYTLQPAFN